MVNNADKCTRFSLLSDASNRITTISIFVEMIFINMFLAKRVDCPWKELPCDIKHLILENLDMIIMLKKLICFSFCLIKCFHDCFFIKERPKAKKNLKTNEEKMDHRIKKPLS